MSSRNRNKKISRHMTAEAKKTVIDIKQAVNSQPLQKCIIGGRW